MELNLSSLGTLVPARPCCLFYETRHQIYWKSNLDHIVFASILWCKTHKQIKLKTNRDQSIDWTHIKILTLPFMCTQKLPVLYWINNLIQKFTLQRWTLFSLFKNYSFVEVIHMLVRFSKTKFFLWNTSNADKNGINEQNIHSTDRKITLERENSVHPFLGKFWKLTLCLYKGGQFQLC